MRTGRLLALILAFGLALALPACGGGGGGGSSPPAVGSCVTGNGPPVTVSGTMRYERLTLTPGVGLGLPLITRPARFVDVEVRVSPAGTCYGRGSTDENGDYSITVMPPENTVLEVVVSSRTTQDPLRDVTVHDANPPGSDTHDPTNVFEKISAAFVASGSPVVNVTVPYNAGTGDRPSIGFNILDVLLTGWETVRLSPGVPAMPPLHAYTRLGNNFTVGTTFYLDSISSIVILGGVNGLLDGSDTDYFDDPVIAHEFGHYVEGKLGHNLSRGGSHGGELLEPGFAWSEGQATAFACLTIGSRFYTDSITTSGGLGLEVDVDASAQSNTGIGSEQSVQEIVYDLADGGPDGPADTDGDAIGLSISDLYGVMFSFDPATDAPYIGLFLDRVVASTSVTSGDITTLLAGTTGDPGSQNISYPLTGGDVWPVLVPIPSPSVPGSVDSKTANPCRALSSSVWYRLSVPSTQSVQITLTITPDTGDDDLDLFLTRNDDANVNIASSTNTGATNESIGPINLTAGEYLLRVEANCFGLGNAASYTLLVQ